MTANELTTIDFHGATLIARRGDTPAETLVAMKPIVEGMGLQWEKQRIKLAGHPVLAPALRVVPFASAGGPQDTVALPLTRLNFWLATVNPNKVPNLETRAKILAYQEECADVLFGHFFRKAANENADLARRIELLTEKVDSLMLAADARVAALERVTVRELLDIAKAVSKGRKSLNGKVRNALIATAADNDVKGCRRCPHTGVWLFPVEFANTWMKTVGGAWVADHNAAKIGQGVIQFPRRKPANRSKAEDDKAG